MKNVESKDIPGIAKTLVARYGADNLRKLIDPRSPGQFAFEYDRSPERDGTTITSPFPCANHVANTTKRGWLAVRLVEEHMDPHGAKWREVAKIPDNLMIAGHPA